MDPFTHAAVSALAGRAGLQRLSRFAMVAVVAGGLLPDVDVLSRLGGVRPYVLFHRTATHSLLGAGLLGLAVAFVLWRWGEHNTWEQTRPLGLLLAALCGAALHLLLDLGDSYGEQLLWPWKQHWYAAALWPQLDPWLLILLLVAVGVPWLLALVGEEMGARRRRGPDGAAIAGLVVVALYCGWRASLHARAVALLESSTFHRAVPEQVEAFPESYSPLVWRGVAATAASYEVVSVPVGPGARFDPDFSRTFYKPEDSPELKVARSLPDVQRWLRFARFPLAQVELTDEGYRIAFRDLRFSVRERFWSNPVVLVELNRARQPQRIQWQFGTPD